MKKAVFVVAALVAGDALAQGVPFLDAYRRREQQIQMEQMQQLQMLQQMQQMQLMEQQREAMRQQTLQMQEQQRQLQAQEERTLGNSCVVPHAKLGDSVNIGGRSGVIERISGPSSRCPNPQAPVRAYVSF
jgi:hypothetical protein